MFQWIPNRIKLFPREWMIIHRHRLYTSLVYLIMRKYSVLWTIYLIFQRLSRGQTLQDFYFLVNSACNFNFSWEIPMRTLSTLPSETVQWRCTLNARWSCRPCTDRWSHVIIGQLRRQSKTSSTCTQGLVLSKWTVYRISRNFSWSKI